MSKKQKALVLNNRQLRARTSKDPRKSSTTTSRKPNPSAVARPAPSRETPHHSYALEYVKKIEKRYEDRPEFYTAFMSVMLCYRKQMPCKDDPDKAVLGKEEVCEYMKKIFEGEPELLAEFSSFLKPFEDAMDLSAEFSSFLTSRTAEPVNTSAGPSPLSQELTFLNKLKERYAQRPEVYATFLHILQCYQKPTPCKDDPDKAATVEEEVYNQAARLFEDAPDLLTEFSSYLTCFKPNPAETRGKK